MKKCTGCNQTKELSQFNLNRGKPGARCKACTRLWSAEYRRKNPDRAAASSRHSYLKNREKRLIYQHAYEIANAVRNAAARREYADKNKSKLLETKRIYRIKNAEKIKAYYHLNYFRDKPLQIARIAKRKAAKIKSTTSWASHEKIKEFYESAEALRMILGEWYHVDHIVPLQSPLVCGLHNEFNLRVISAFSNLSKGNRTWEGMW